MTALLDLAQNLIDISGRESLPRSGPNRTKLRLRGAARMRLPGFLQDPVNPLIHRHMVPASDLSNLLDLRVFQENFQCPLHRDEPK